MNLHRFAPELTLGGGYLQEITVPKGPKGKINLEGSSEKCEPNLELKTCIISVMIFIIIVVIFNFITTCYNNIFDESGFQGGKVKYNIKSIVRSLVYGIFILSISLSFIMILYYY
jgi:hypothetical protein